jgi:hypothetical protein
MGPVRRDRLRIRSADAAREAGSGDLAVDSGAAHREQLGELGGRVVFGLDKFEDVDALARAELGLLALELAVGASDRHPFACAHPQQVDLELGERGGC